MALNKNKFGDEEHKTTHPKFPPKKFPMKFPMEISMEISTPESAFRKFPESPVAFERFESKPEGQNYKLKVRKMTRKD